MDTLKPTINRLILDFDESMNQRVHKTFSLFTTDKIKDGIELIDYNPNNNVITYYEHKCKKRSIEVDSIIYIKEINQFSESELLRFQKVSWIFIFNKNLHKFKPFDNYLDYLNSKLFTKIEIKTLTDRRPDIFNIN